MRSFLCSCAALLIASTASAQTRTVTSTTGNSGNLSAVVRVGDVLYLSGQLPGVRGQPMDTTIQGQTRQTLEKIKAQVEANGAKMENVAKCTVFLVDAKDFSGMNSAYREFWPKDPPARSTVVVAALVSPSAKLEIECIAAIVK